MKYKKLNLSNEEIFKRVERHELVICHLKHESGVLTPFIMDNNNKKYEMPDGYMAYDKKHFYRKFV